MKFQLNRLPAKRACLIGPSGLNSIRSCSNYHSSYPRAFFFFLSFFLLFPPPLGFFNETKFRREPDQEVSTKNRSLGQKPLPFRTIDIATHSIHSYAFRKINYKRLNVSTSDEIPRNSMGIWNTSNGIASDLFARWKKKKLELKIVLEFSKLENIFQGIYFKGFRRFTRRLDKISLNHIANSHATIEKMVNDL